MDVTLFFFIFGLEIHIHQKTTLIIMANKRDLKRSINYITSELFAETMAAVIYSGKVDKEAGIICWHRSSSQEMILSNASLIPNRNESK